MQRQRSTDRRPWWGAGLCIVVFGVVACSGSDTGIAKATPASPPAAVAREVPSTTVPSTTVPATATTATATPAVTDPVTALHDATTSLTTSYHFVSTVTLDGAVALVADGDRVGDGSRLTLTSSDGYASYVITPDGSWVMLADGDWQALDGSPANTDPIGALLTPTAVQAKTSDGSTSHLSVTVAPASLGIPGDTPVELDVAITSNVLSSVTYATSLGDKPATVTATFGPAHDPTPIGPPI